MHVQLLISLVIISEKWNNILYEEKEMIPITNWTIWDDVMYSTVRIEVNFPNGVSGTGTGFFYSYYFEGREVPVIVTNKHVIDGGKTFKVKFTIQDENGKPSNLQHFDWEATDYEPFIIRHPDESVDLCIILYAYAVQKASDEGFRLFYRVLKEKEIATSYQLQNELSTIEEITMVGYPNGLWDEVNNLPIMRRGITATPPSVAYNGKQEFIIDAACFPGSSGSPVMVIDHGSYHDRNGTLIVGKTRALLLGILYAGPQMIATGEIKVVDMPMVNRPITETKLMLNLGYVISSSKILDFEPIIKAMIKN